MIRRAALAQGWGVRLGLTRVLALLRPAALDPINALRLRTSGPFAVADEMASLAAVPDGWRRVHGFGGLGARPLVVVSRALHDPVSGAAVATEWQEAQSRLAGLSRVSTHVFAARSGHVMQFDEPGVIVRAVRDVLDELNARSAR